jgi:hypothetical protein
MPLSPTATPKTTASRIVPAKCPQNIIQIPVAKREITSGKLFGRIVFAAFKVRIVSIPAVFSEYETK